MCWDIPRRGASSHEIRRDHHRFGSGRKSSVLPTCGSGMAGRIDRKGQCRRHVHQYRVHAHEDDGPPGANRALRAECLALGRARRERDAPTFQRSSRRKTRSSRVSAAEYKRKSGCIRIYISTRGRPDSRMRTRFKWAILFSNPRKFSSTRAAAQTSLTFRVSTRPTFSPMKASWS